MSVSKKIIIVSLSGLIVLGIVAMLVSMLVSERLQVGGADRERSASSDEQPVEREPHPRAPPENVHKRVKA